MHEMLRPLELMLLCLAEGEHHGYALKNSGLKLGRAVYDEMPTNAGPYLPQIFPYGQGGRPATYKR